MIRMTGYLSNLIAGEAAISMIAYCSLSYYGLVSDLWISSLIGRQQCKRKKSPANIVTQYY